MTWSRELRSKDRGSWSVLEARIRVGRKGARQAVEDVVQAQRQGEITQEILTSTLVAIAGEERRIRGTSAWSLLCCE